MYAQNKEDLILKGLLNNKSIGFYVDVGANDPTLDSVSKIFYDSGWQGINIEPIRTVYKRLKEQRPRDININLGVGARKSHLKFREYKGGDGLSTFNLKNKLDPAYKTREYRVEVDTLSNIIEKNAAGKLIDFLKIDVEGFEKEVIDGLDLIKHRPRIICIESNNIYSGRDWRGNILANDYIEAFFDGVNRYYVRREDENLIANFSYPEAALSGNPLNIRAYQDMMNEVVKPIEEDLHRSKTQLKDLQQNNNHLKTLQTDLSYLASQFFKQGIKKVKELLHVKK